jgi:SAM-dependent methyltransferase
VNPVSRLALLWHEADSDARMHYGGFLHLVERMRQLGFGDLRGLRILDIGCGERAPLALLMAAHGAEVDALDLVPVRLGWRRPTMWLLLLRASGARSMARQIVRDFLHTFRYWRRLRRLLGRRLPFAAVRLRLGDAQRLEIPDETFDFVVSAAVWEHLPDVRAATREVNRVLKREGMGSIQAALFPALGGGHHAEWHDLSPGRRRTIRPWDHLLPGAQPLPLYCNGWRAHQFREAFQQETDLISWELGEPRGGEYLTPELRQELAEYSETDLLVGFCTAWVRKRRE